MGHFGTEKIITLFFAIANSEIYVHHNKTLYNIRMIDPKLLTLIQVSEDGSFSQAAKSLNLTQPAVSTHIKLLEKELGCQLVVRTKNSAKLTQEGEIAVHYARRMQALYARMDQKIQDAKTQRFSLSIGFTHTAQNSSVIEAIARYAAHQPSLKINFVTGFIKDLYEQVDEYVLDLAIVEGPNENPSLNSILLDTDRIMAAVSPKNELAKKEVVTLDDLRKQKMILRGKASATRQLFEASLESNGASLSEFDVMVESESLGVIKDLVKANDGVSILAASSCADDVKKGKIVLLPILGLAMTRQVNIIFQKGFSHVEVLNGILKEYREVKAESH